MNNLWIGHTHMCELYVFGRWNSVSRRFYRWKQSYETHEVQYSIGYGDRRFTVTMLTLVSRGFQASKGHRDCWRRGSTSRHRMALKHGGLRRALYALVLFGVGLCVYLYWAQVGKDFPSIAPRFRQTNSGRRWVPSKSLVHKLSTIHTRTHVMYIRALASLLRGEIVNITTIIRTYFYITNFSSYRNNIYMYNSNYWF